MKSASPPGLARRHIVAATTGNALEFYAFVTYAFFAVQIGRTFFPAHSAYASLMLSLATFGAGFVTRPLGGWVIGAYADRAGRRAAMTLCFVLMGTSVVALALTPSYASIGLAAPIIALVARMVQGFSLGGEVGASTAFLLEAAPLNGRGRIVAWQGASQGIAAIVGGTVGVILAAVMTPAALDAYGWRIALLLGAVTLPFGFWIRRHLPETLLLEDRHPNALKRAAQEPSALVETLVEETGAGTGAVAEPGARADADAEAEAEAGAGAGAGAAAGTGLGAGARPGPGTELGTATSAEPAASSFRIRTHGRLIAVALMFCAAATISTYIRHYMTTFAEHTLQIGTTAAFAATVAGNAAAVIAILFGGRLSDRVGRRTAMLWPNLVFLVAAYPTFLWIVESRNATVLLIGSALLGFMASVAIGAFYPALTESVPKHVRGRVVATIYAISIAIFGGTAQLIVTWLIHVTGNPMAPAWYLIAATVVGQIAIMFMRESAPGLTLVGSPRYAR